MLRWYVREEGAGRYGSRLAVSGWRLAPCHIVPTGHRSITYGHRSQILRTRGRGDLMQKLQRAMSCETVRYFRDLEAWQSAMDLAVAAHSFAGQLPPTHRFELASQIRRSASLGSEQHCRGTFAARRSRLSPSRANSAGLTRRTGYPGRDRDPIEARRRGRCTKPASRSGANRKTPPRACAERSE